MPQLSAEIVFDQESHVYRCGGVVVPSVTQVLQSVGLYSDLSKIDPDVLEWKRNLGTQVHAATELDDLDNLGDYDPQIDGYIKAWRQFKTDTGFKSTHIEQRVFHKSHKYAGTLDRIGKFGDSGALVDIKTGAIDLMTVGPQTAAYAEAWGFSGKRYAVQLMDGKYKLVQCKNKLDFQVFLNCLNIWKWKGIHK